MTLAELQNLVDHCVVVEHKLRDDYPDCAIFVTCELTRIGLSVTCKRHSRIESRQNRIDFTWVELQSSVADFHSQIDIMCSAIRR